MLYDHLIIIKMNSFEVNKLVAAILVTILIVFGMVIRQKIWGQPPFPLEIVFLLAAVFAIAEFMLLGFEWNDIQNAFIQKFKIIVFLLPL